MLCDTLNEYLSLVTCVHLIMYILHTVKHHLNDPGSLGRPLGKSGCGSFNWYSYLEGRLADILAILREVGLIGRGRLYSTLRYICVYNYVV